MAFIRFIMAMCWGFVMLGMVQGVGHEMEDLMKAVKEGRLKKIKRWLRNEDNIHTRIDGNGSTLLHLLSRGSEEDERKRLSILSWVLPLDPLDVNARDKWGKTALHYAAEEGHVDTVAMLLSHPDNNLSIFDSNGNTAIHYAMKNGRVFVMKKVWKRMKIIRTFETENK